MERRAWVSVTVGQIFIPDNGDVVRGTVNIRNIGKTPAEHFTGQIVLTFLREEERPDFNYGAGHLQSPIQGGTLIPGSEHEVTTLAIGGPRGGAPGNLSGNDALRRSVSSADLFGVTYGRLTYSDIFGVEHWLTFCASGTGTPYKRKGIEGCAEYNGVDHNQ